MGTRDLGTHIVELHEQGMLTLTGEGTHLNLPAHETLDLFNWLLIHREQLVQSAHSHPMAAGNLPPSDDETDEPDRPVDEP